MSTGIWCPPELGVHLRFVSTSVWRPSELGRILSLNQLDGFPGSLVDAAQPANKNQIKIS